MQTPPNLQKGDTVVILSTARKIGQKALQPAVKLLEKWGLQVRLGKTIGAEAHQFAGDDRLRVLDLQEALDNPNIKAIWCARGGYGTVRIIDAIDFTKFKQNPKWIIGYSDVTTLHNHIHTLGIQTIHALMAGEVHTVNHTIYDGLRQILFGKTDTITYTTEEKLNKTGVATGQLIGGNLSILYSLCGSNSAITTNGKILFIEDLDEYLYHVDRMMQNLKRNGMLTNLSGLIVGGMSAMNDNTIPFGKNVKQIIYEAVQAYSYPVCFDFPAGHVTNNHSLILGREAQLNITKNDVSLSFK